jgi:hypothetical protein
MLDKTLLPQLPGDIDNGAGAQTAFAQEVNLGGGFALSDKGEKELGVPLPHHLSVSGPHAGFRSGYRCLIGEFIH